MKKLYFALVLILSLAGCEKKAPVQHSITSDIQEIGVNKMGLTEDGSAVVLNISSDIYWIAEIPEDWISAFPVAGFGKDTKVTLSIDGNEGAARQMTIRFVATDGTETEVLVHQESGETVVNFLTLSFSESMPVCSGVGSGPTVINGEGYHLVGGELVFDQDARVIVGPVEPHDRMAFKLSLEASGGTVETYVSNKETIGIKLRENAFHFDELTSFYIGLVAPQGTKLAKIVVDEGKVGQGQFVRFGDGKPVGYVYFSDDFKWLSDFSDVDYIRTLDNTGEQFWSNLVGEDGFNPKGWILSDNTLKRRVYCNSNCVKFGRAANSQGSGGGLVTPLLGIPEECFSNVRLDISACAFYTGASFDAESALLVRIIGSGEIVGTGSSSVTVAFDKSSEKKAIWDNSKVEYRAANVWDAIEIFVTGASCDTKFAIETTVETTKGRMLLESVTVSKTE